MIFRGDPSGVGEIGDVSLLYKVESSIAALSVSGDGLIKCRNSVGEFEGQLPI